MLDESISESIYWKDPINITKEQWMLLLEDKEIITEKDLQLLKLVYDFENCMAAAKQLAQILRMPHHAPLNSQVGRLGKRIVTSLNIPAPKQKYGEGFNWWNVPFWGEKRKDRCYWILRPELIDAMYELSAMEETSGDGVNLAEEIDVNIHKHLYEGAKKQIWVNSYERSGAARERCIKHYGTQCVICGFDFEKTYGEVGANVIHVHHLKPLSEIGETYSVDPIKDLRPVCPNCHVIIHQKNPAYSIDEVVVMIKGIRWREGVSS